MIRQFRFRETSSGPNSTTQTKTIRFNIGRWLVPVIILGLLVPSCAVGGQNQTKPRQLQTADITAVVQAMQDEIYDYGYQRDFWGFETSGPRGPEAEFEIYITPTLELAHGGVSGQVIYRYPPFGEVIRTFIIDPRGIVKCPQTLRTASYDGRTP